MKSLLTICAVLAIVSSAAGAERPASEGDKRYEDYCKRVGSTYDDTFRAASKIDTNKPIGEFEAFVLSSAYFYVHFGGCGGTKLPQDKGDTWVSDTLVGYAGQPGAKIIVEKKTAVTYSEGKPRVSDPKTYSQYVKTPIKSVEPTRALPGARGSP
jgi:hypothetical protein